MGSLFKSKSEVVQDPTAIEAFNTIRPALQTAVTGGQAMYDFYGANPAYSGQRVAALNPFQTNSANALGNFSNAMTTNAANAASNLGFGNISAGMGFGNNAQDIYSRFSGDPTQQIIDQAGQYANNPYVNGLIDASARDVTRNLFESQLPGIDRAATGGGNLNSTRAGVESAIAKRGAADRLADMSSQIRSQFFGTGLNMAQNQYNQNLQNMLQSNQGLADAANLGLTGLTNAQNIAQAGFNQGQVAGGVFQNQNQAELNANKALFDESLANRANIVNLLSSIASGGQGFKGSAGLNTSPSVAQQVGSIIGAFA